MLLHLLLPQCIITELKKFPMFCLIVSGNFTLDKESIFLSAVCEGLGSVHDSTVYLFYTYCIARRS